MPDRFRVYQPLEHNGLMLDNYIFRLIEFMICFRLDNLVPEKVIFASTDIRYRDTEEECSWVHKGHLGVAEAEHTTPNHQESRGCSSRTSRDSVLVKVTGLKN